MRHDVGIRGLGKTPNEAFEMAAVALTSAVTSLDRVEAKESLPVHCQAPDMDVQSMLFSQFHVEFQNNNLTGEIRGEKIDLQKHWFQDPERI